MTLIIEIKLSADTCVGMLSVSFLVSILETDVISVLFYTAVFELS